MRRRGDALASALITLLALNGLRISEALNADIDDLSTERGHRTLAIVRKGGKHVTIPIASRAGRALSNAVEQLDDFLLSELVELHDETKPKRTRLFSGPFLPSRYTDFYDFAMLRRLYVCLTVVAGRLQDQWEPPRCRGEELVLRAVLEHSETCLEEETNESTDAFADLRDRLFNDFDHEYLFDPAFDGIDDPTTDEGSQLGVHALHPSDWFTPFRPGSPVHPMLS